MFIKSLLLSTEQMETLDVYVIIGISRSSCALLSIEYLQVYCLLFLSPILLISLIPAPTKAEGR